MDNMNKQKEKYKKLKFDKSLFSESIKTPIKKTPKQPAKTKPKKQKQSSINEQLLLKSGICISCSDHAEQPGIGKNKGVIHWCRRKAETEQQYKWIYKRISNKILVGQCPKRKK